MSKDKSDATYTVKPVLPKGSGHYEVSKFGDSPEPMESYDVILPVGRSRQTLWCSCQGFRRQTYAKSLHKHVKLVREFIRQGEPAGRIYRLDGVADQVDIIVVNANAFAG